jgi:hypothetical protein
VSLVPRREVPSRFERPEQADLDAGLRSALAEYVRTTAHA